MGSIHIRRNGKVYKVDENATGKEVKKMLKLPPDSILRNVRNQVIGDNEPIKKKVKDNEPVASEPKFRYW